MTFPLQFENTLTKSLPQVEVAALLEAIQTPAPASVRVNAKKGATIQPDLIQTAVPWSEHAFILKERPAYFADPAFHAGAYYSQEASSTIIEEVVKQLLETMPSKAIMLDLCGAPGGKSTILASQLRAEDVLVANEVIHSRTPVLHENLIKWGAANHIVTRADAFHLGQSGILFDLILADMPCSGEGMFRKDPDSMNEWSPENVNHCALRQTKIAHEIWPALKEGGYLIYSTCTYNRQENENNVNQICKELGGELLVLSVEQHAEVYFQETGMYRLMPHRSMGEGFFFAVIRKVSNSLASPSHRKGNKGNFTPVRINEIPSSSLGCYRRENEIYGIQPFAMDSALDILNLLPMIYAPGTLLGKTFEKKGGPALFKPEVGLALLSLSSQHYPKIALTDEQAIAYLQRQSLPNALALKGISTATWGRIALGFVNGVNHQWNNLWPMEWRLRADKVQPISIIERGSS